MVRVGRVPFAVVAVTLGLAAGSGWAAEPPALSVNRDIRAQVTARQATILSAGMAGRLKEVLVEDGDRFKEGQVLARFDCAAQEGHFARARAALEKEQKVHAANQRLVKLGSVSGVELEVSAAKVAEAATEVRLAQVPVERCTVTAPFAGRVAGVSAHAHQHVAEGQALLDILNDRELEVEVIVPSPWLAWVKPGLPFAVEVIETGRRYSVAVGRVSGRVDAVSQSVKVYGRLLDGTGDLLAGMSGRALLTPPEGPAP